MAKKKTKYRLEALLTVKLRVKRNSEIELAKSVKALKQEEEKLNVLEEEKQEIIDHRVHTRREMSRRVASGESQISDSHGHINYIKRLQEDEEKKDEEIQEQKEVVLRAEERVAQAKRDYIDACKEVKIMQKHKELWKKKLAHELEREDAKVMNELGNVLYQLPSNKEKRGQIL